MPGNPTGPTLFWTPSQRCPQGQCWHAVGTLDCGRRGRLLPSGWTVYQPGPLEEAPRQPGAVAGWPGAEARVSGAGAPAGTLASKDLAEGSRVECGTPGWPWLQSTGNPTGLLPELCGSALLFQKPSTPSRPRTARRSSLLPTWGLWSQGQPRHTHPQPWVPRPPFLWIIRSPTVRCYHTTTRTVLHLSRKAAGERTLNSTSTFLTENPLRADASPGAGAADPKVSALE